MVNFSWKVIALPAPQFDCWHLVSCIKYLDLVSCCWIFLQGEWNAEVKYIIKQYVFINEI